MRSDKINFQMNKIVCFEKLIILNLNDTHRPTTIVYRITPNDHISAALPEYMVFALRISGETYAGHPRLS